MLLNKNFKLNLVHLLNKKKLYHQLHLEGVNPFCKLFTVCMLAPALVYVIMHTSYTEKKLEAVIVHSTRKV